MTLFWIPALFIYWALIGLPDVLFWLLIIPMFTQDCWDYSRDKKQELEAQRAQVEIASWSKK